MTEPGITLTLDAARKWGKARRDTVKRSDHGRFLAGDRDPVSIIETQNESRIQQLIPVRIGRMLQSNFAYYRGTAATMAQDLSTEPRTDLNVISCGDAHVSNFGLFAAPDRRVLLDLNDFDESGPAPWEWDVKRLAASVEVGFRYRGFTPEQSRDACLGTVRAYRETMAALTGINALDRYYYRAEIEDVEGLAADEDGVALIRKTVNKAKKRTSEKVLNKIVTTLDDGELRIVDQPPILQHIDDVVGHAEVQMVVDKYRETLRPDVSLLLSKFRLVDYALRVVGVGSVGTRCFVLLLVGPQGEPMFIQLKEAQPSVLETWGGIQPVPLAGAGDRAADSDGYRVASTQQVLQAASDPFLGWIDDVRGVDYYGRQFRDMKGSVDLEILTVGQFERYGQICARLLARAHSQSAGWAAIPGYLGSSDVFDRAIAGWCKDYADQAERDFAALEAAVKSGRVPCEAGV